MSATVTAPAFDFVVFYVTDLDASCRFFEQSLGFARLLEGDGPGFRQFVDGKGMGFGLSETRDDAHRPGEVQLYLKSDDLAGLRDAWQARGVAATPIVEMPFGPIFTIATPDGCTLVPLGQVPLTR